jgi:hypothetical protein
MVTNIHEDTVSVVPVNAMGSSSSTVGSGKIDTYDPILSKTKKKPLRNMIKRKTLEVIHNDR